MRIGAVFPHQEIGSDPVLIRDWAQAAEALGYSHIVAYDHVLGAVHSDREPPLKGPYDENDAFHEPVVLFAWLAGQTTTIGFATGILILPQRQTALVAKQVAELDILSGGRIRLGVGTGWNFVEYDSLNENFDDRGARMTEQVNLLRTLWQEPVIEFNGDFHQIQRAGIKPLPTGKIPIWFGGFTDVAFRRAAILGDGFILGGSQKHNLAASNRLRELVSAANRDWHEFGIEAFLNYQDGEEKWRLYAEQWQGNQATYISMRATGLQGVGPGLSSPAEHISALTRFWNCVGELSETSQ